ncbi:MAG: BatD family protein, partial [Flavobacteriales bacterium]
SGEKKKVKSNSPMLKVKPLPEKGRPESFNGSVGKFNFNVNVKKRKLRTNESTNLIIKLSGDGNFKLLSPPQIKFPPDFETYDPKISDNTNITKTGITGSKKYDYLIIPRQKGEYKIPAIKFSYFNPNKEKYVQLTTDDIKFKVTGQGGDTDDTYLTMNKEDVEILDKDIRFIKTHDSNAELHKKDELLFHSSYYIAGISLPPLISMIFFLFWKRREKKLKDKSGLRQKQADKTAKKRLKEAREALNKGKESKFYDLLYKAIFGYFSDKFKIKRAELNHKKIEKSLKENEIDENLINELLKNIERCEMAKYAPTSDISAEEVYNQTEEHISRIEQKISNTSII